MMLKGQKTNKMHEPGQAYITSKIVLNLFVHMLEETFIVEILSNVKTFIRIKSFDKRMHLRFCISMCPARLVCVYVSEAQTDPGQYVYVLCIHQWRRHTRPGQCVCILYVHAVYISVTQTGPEVSVCTEYNISGVNRSRLE